MGEGVMRGEAKVAGVGAVSGCLRSVPAVPPVEQPIPSTSSPVSSHLTSKAASDAGLKTVQRPAWEIDDWEFAGVEDEQVGEPLPRIVLSTVPNFQEAKEVSMELKQTLVFIYLHTAPLEHALHPRLLPRKWRPRLFRPLDCSRKAPKFSYCFSQNVVASIVSDNNVWKATSENPELKSYMPSYQTESHFHGSYVKFEDDSDLNLTENMDASFMNELKNLGTRVSSMVSNLQS